MKIRLEREVEVHKLPAVKAQPGNRRIMRF